MPVLIRPVPPRMRTSIAGDCNVEAEVVSSRKVTRPSITTHQSPSACVLRVASPDS